MRLPHSMPRPRWNPNVLDANRLFYALWTTALFLLLIWGVYAINEAYALNWRRWGNHPREWEHWTGVFTYPFLHGDLEHLWNNTATFFTLNGLLFYFYRSIAARTWILLYMLSGVGLWVFAKGGNHIGASGINYALAAFLFASGVVRKSQLLLRVTLLVAFLYGGMVWWMLPIDEHISWEGHIAGAVSGLLMAVVFRKKGPLPDLELQPPAPDERLPDWWAAAHPEHPDVVRQRELDANQTTTAEDGTSQDVKFRIVPKSSSNKNAPTDGRGDLNSKG
ncbi:MAG: rhomboid family intramembrane serine protease [Crocinitomicaceae bacterium TMED209]|nr:MAG: rhomboid family intramembrane serine protease [Crocinitomicaceae bacterium TMED209]